MISLLNIVKKILNEGLSFRELMKFSEPKRIRRSNKMRVRSMPITAAKEGEQWNFKYKSDPSHITHRASTTRNVFGVPTTTTTKGHSGNITFKKGTNEGDSALDMQCIVDCTCEDYRYKYAVANNDKDAGKLGNDSLNQCNGAMPNQTNPYLRPGLCKHLLSVRNYLKTKLEESQKPTLYEKLDDIVLRHPNGTVEYDE